MVFIIYLSILFFFNMYQGYYLICIEDGQYVGIIRIMDILKGIYRCFVVLIMKGVIRGKLYLIKI